MITNSIVRVPRLPQGQGSIATYLEKALGTNVLRWYVSDVVDDHYVVEATFCSELPRTDESPVTGQYYPGKRAVINLIPTGVGCEIGGYAGDAAPITDLLAGVVDYVVTNPNAVNASNFIHLPNNVLYTEGSLIDAFAKGCLNLYVPEHNRVGLIVEHADDRVIDLVYNLVNCARATFGVNIEHCVVTPASIGSTCVRNESGAYVGTVERADILLDACRQLVAKGVNAIAVTTKVRDLPAEEYAAHFLGKHPNPVGGTEAVISHLICREFGIPAAHAPIINFVSNREWGKPSLPPTLQAEIVDPRGAGERASVSGLESVLLGLRRAPQITLSPKSSPVDVINLNNVMAVIAPSGCMGGIPVLSAYAKGIPVIAVRENRTILSVNKSKLDLPEVIEVENYAEAAGIVVALKRGISLSSIRRPIHAVRPGARE